MKLKFLLFALLTFGFGVESYGQATLPVSRTSWNSAPTGWTDILPQPYLSTFACSGSDGSKFDTTGNSTVVNFSGTPNNVSFVVKSNNPSSTSVLLVQQSADGSAYTTVVSLTGATGLPTTCSTKGPYTLNAATKFVKWTFTKGSSNMTMDDVSITEVPCATPAPTGTISQTPSCGSTVLTHSAPVALQTYWQTTATGTSQTNPTTSPFNVTSSGTYYVRSFNGTCWSSTNISTTVVINTTPMITTQPSNQTAVIPAAATFSVVASGGGTQSFQWQVSTDGGVTWNDVTGGSGATTASYTTAATAESMNGNRYRVIVKNTVCGSEVTSNGNARLILTNAAPNNGLNLIPCPGATTVNLSWTASTGTPVPTGYIIFAETGSSIPNSTAAAAGAANNFTANTNYSLATSYGSLGKAVFKGNATSATVTGLTAGATYTFKVVAYYSETLTAWSSALQNTSVNSSYIKTISISVPNVSVVAASKALTQSVVSWTNPVSGSCSYEVLVIAYQGTSSFVPTGNGSAYNPNSVYAGQNSIVYKGVVSGTTGNVTVTGLSEDTNYCYKIFVRSGTDWNNGVSVCQTTGLNYCAAAGNTDDSTGVTGVIFNTINNTSTGEFDYTDFTGISTTVTIGQTYDITVRANTDGDFDITARAWIDWNRDGSFDNSERYELGNAFDVTDGTTSESPLSIEVPSGAVAGNTRMRIFVKSNAASPNPNACEDSGNYGEAEDYTIKIVRPTGAEINVKGGSISIASGSADPYSLNNTLFAATNIGATTAAKTFTIENSGLSALILNSNPAVTITGANAGDFSVSQQPSTSVASLGNTVFSIVFNPSVFGERNAIVSISNNDTTGNESTYTFAIRGTGKCGATISSSVSPIEGPENTELTITSPSNLTNATASIGGIAMTVVSSTNTALVVKVPHAAVSGNISITLQTGCISTVAFTVIDKLIAGCQTSSASALGNLIISEIADATKNTSTLIEIFNGTANPVGLSGYSLKIFNNGSTSTVSGSVNLTGTLAPGATHIVSIGTTICNLTGLTATVNQSEDSFSGINFKLDSSDFIGLYQGSTMVDAFGVYGSGTWANSLNVGASGVNFKRKTAAEPLPNPNFILADWDYVDWTTCENSDYSNVGVYDFSRGVPPVVTVQPQFVGTCSATTSLSVSATEGVSGGNALAYQWYELIPPANTFTALAGATSPTLTITTANSYERQYYLQVRENGATCYKASAAVKVINTGTSWTTTGWSNGIPDGTRAVIINENYNTAGKPFECCSLIVNNGKVLTIAAGSYVKVENGITNSGTINIDNSGSLVQVTDVDNATANNNLGSVNMKREANQMYRRFDYTYWSSPVKGFMLSALSPLTLPDKYFKWNSSGMTWEVIMNGAAIMDAGVGYIIRAPQNYPIDMPPMVPTPPAPFISNFTGVPNNGIVKVGVSGNNDTVEANYKFNLLGNPYPSAIDADKLITQNSNLNGTLYFWTHNTAISSVPVNGQYSYSSADYATYNLTGPTGTGTASGNGGLNSNLPSGKIAAGQGFFVRGLANGIATFNNTMRITDNNSQFFRNQNEQLTTAELERHRIWLNISNAQNVTSQTLTGYIEGATNEIDRLYDGELLGGQAVILYSLVGATRLLSQGRALPFTDSDVVPMGYRSTEAGTLQIKIDHVDGLFETQNIYLQDNVMNSIHDLKESPYSFSSEAGTFNDRFILRYTNETLGVKDNIDIQKSVSVVVNKGMISVVSSMDDISSIFLYDMLGRQIGTQQHVNAKNTSIASVAKDQSVIIKIVLVSGEIVSKKLML